jgi:hypothetical protein
MKEIVKLSLYMISSNLSFSSTPLGGPIFRALNSLESPFLLFLWSFTLQLATFLFFFSFLVLFYFLILSL